MAFNNYLEDENDKPYFTTNSLAYYYDKMEGFAKAVDGSAKALNLTKEEVEKQLTLYINQNKNELDQRLAQWDGKLETFDSSVETLLTEWVDDGTLTPLIDSTLIDQKIAPVKVQLAKTGEEVKRKRELEDLSPTVLSAIQGGEGTEFNLLTIPQDKSVTPNKTTFFTVSKNLLNKEELQVGYTVDAGNGKAVFQDGNTFYTTPFIPVTPETKYSYVNDTNIRVAFYSAPQNEGAFISGISQPPVPTITTPAGTKYVRYSFRIASLPLQQFVLGETLPEYEEYGKSAFDTSTIADGSMPLAKLMELPSVTGGEKKKYLKRISTAQYKVYTKISGNYWVVMEIIRSNANCFDFGKTWIVTLSEENPLISGVTENIVHIATESGVWTYAIYETTGADFMGSHHGNDRLIFHEWYADFVPVSLGVGSGVACDDLNLTQKSRLNRPLTTVDVAEVWKEFDFSEGRADVKYSIDWLEPTEILYAYVAMCTFSRGSDTFTRGRYLNDDTIQVIDTNQFARRFYDAHGVNMWNGNGSGLGAKLEILNPKEALDNYSKNGVRKTHISDKDLYNKLYATRIDVPMTIPAGEKWDVNFYVSFRKK